MTEKDKMLAGLPYDPGDDELALLRRRSKEACRDYDPLVSPDGIKNIVGHFGKDVFIESGFKADYGFNITLGDNVFINYNCVILDCAPVTMGSNVFIGPNCGFYTAVHPTDFEQRNEGIETAKPITVGDNVWIGGGVTVLPGVNIGEGAVIGAGSVVVKDVPPYCVAVGNPCAVKKELK